VIFGGWDDARVARTSDDEEPVGSPAGDMTLASYEAASDRYVRESARPGTAVLAFLDEFADLVNTGMVLELGSGPGWDASYLETRGLRVIRTDGAESFVELLRSAGHVARILDIRTGDLGGPYDAVLADAVLLHLSRDQFVDCLRRARNAVRGGGLLGFTLKEGDGESWSRAKLDLPRHFTFWREPAVRAALSASGWRVRSVQHVAGRSEPWLFVIAHAEINLEST
jgi:SAM-dependent methyltransferase